MNYLDLLFREAQRLHSQSANPDLEPVLVDVAITINQTDGLDKSSNSAVVAPPGTLVYQPGARGKPAKFVNYSGVTPTISGPSPYTVEFRGNSFVPSVDETTTIVFGAAGLQFVTISLCNLRRKEV